MIYTTKNDDRLDTICLRHYGATDGVVEAVMFDPVNYDITTAEVFSAGAAITLLAMSASDTVQAQEEHVLWE